MTKPTTIKEYLLTIPDPSRAIVQNTCNRVAELVPDASAAISYGMPAFKNPKTFIYFAAFKNHIGIYPPVAKQSPLIEELSDYLGPKGNLKFPLNKEMPYGLLDRVITALAEQY